MRRIYLAAALASTAMAVATPASAQLIGACPSPLSPPPCIIFDYKKMADWATSQAQEMQKIQETIEQIKEMKSSVMTFGTTLENVPQLNAAAPLSNIAVPGKQFTSVPGAVSSFAPKMFGGTGQNIDQTSQTVTARTQMYRESNAEAFAYSQQNCRMIKESRTRIRELHAAARRATDLRTDWNVNSQIRAEYVRTLAQKNILLAALLESEATALAVKTDPATSPDVQLGNSDAPVPDPKPNENLSRLAQLAQVALEIRNLLTSTRQVEANKGVIAANQNTVATHEQVTQQRDETLKSLMERANAWTARSGKGNGQVVVDRVLAELNGMDASATAMREQPISSLGQALTDRGINVEQMTQNNVDPRQFIGTWADPNKARNTLAMTSALLNGPLNPYIKGDADNKEFRDLVSAYNDLRLQEAWLRPLAEDAKTGIEATSADIDSLNTEEGIDINTETANAKLKDLMGQANELANAISQASDPAEKAQAQKLLIEVQAMIESINQTAPVTTPAG